MHAAVFIDIKESQKNDRAATAITRDPCSFLMEKALTFKPGACHVLDWCWLCLCESPAA